MLTDTILSTPGARKDPVIILLHCLKIPYTSFCVVRTPEVYLHDAIECEGGIKLAFFGGGRSLSCRWAGMAFILNMHILN